MFKRQMFGAHQRLRKRILLAPQSMPVSTGLGTDIRIGT